MRVGERETGQSTAWRQNEEAKHETKRSASVVAFAFAVGVSSRQPKPGVPPGGLGQHGQANALKFCLSRGTPKLGPAFLLISSRALDWASRAVLPLCRWAPVCPVGSEDMKVAFARGVIGAGAQRRWGFSWGVERWFLCCPSKVGRGHRDRPQWQRAVRSAEGACVSVRVAGVGVPWVASGQIRGMRTKAPLWALDSGASAHPPQLSDRALAWRRRRSRLRESYRKKGALPLGRSLPRSTRLEGRSPGWSPTPTGRLGRAPSGRAQPALSFSVALLEIPGLES